MLFQRDAILSFHQVLHFALTPHHLVITKDSALPTRATGAQAIAGFGAVIQRIAPLLPPPQAAILEVMSMAVNIVAGCVDADEKYQEYLGFLKWKEQQKSIEPDSSSLADDLAYAVHAATIVYDELFMPQLNKITERFCAQFENNSTTPTSTILFLSPIKPTLETSSTTSTSYKKITIQGLFDELSETFLKGIAILKNTSLESSF